MHQQQELGGGCCWVHSSCRGDQTFKGCPAAWLTGPRYGQGYRGRRQKGRITPRFLADVMGGWVLFAERDHRTRNRVSEHGGRK